MGSVTHSCHVTRLANDVCLVCVGRLIGVPLSANSWHVT